MGTTTQARVTRAKLSTTVSPETYEFFDQMVKSGQAASIAEAIDVSVAKIRLLENRKRLARATARYFDELEPRAAMEEAALSRDLASGAGGIDFDKEL
jgi:hypothetical protein